MKQFYFYGAILVSLGILGIQACGGDSTSSGSTASLATISSLSSIPSADGMIKSGSSASESPGFSSSLSVSQSLRQNAVSGTPPVLTSISADEVDTLFWNGLIAQINAVGLGGITGEVVEAFWKGVLEISGGDLSCRMAQMTGYMIQNILQATTSACYMKNAPLATSGVAIVSGTATASNLFDKGTTNRLVKVETTFEGSTENIFIKVYGSDTSEGSAGYAVDLYFCATNATAPHSAEQNRYNATTGILSHVSSGVDTWGTHYTVFQGTLVDENGTISFSTDQARTAENYYSGSFGAENFVYREKLLVEGDIITASDRSTSSSFGGNQSRIRTQFSAASPETIRFLSAAVKGKGIPNMGDPFTYTGAYEFRDTHYVLVGSSELLSAVESFDFSSDSFFSDAIDVGVAAQLATNASLSCTATPDVVVTMNMDDSGMQAVKTLCESDFQEMNFCDSGNDSLAAARNLIFNAMSQQ